MRYIQDPITHELIPADQYVDRQERSGIEIMTDIQPYQSMIDGSIITSRSKHKAHLRQHNCIEVGNDSSVIKPTYKPPKPPPGLKEKIIQAVEQIERRRK